MMAIDVELIFLRFERAQSLYVGTSIATKKKFTIKEHHLGSTTESDVIQEILILANLSHKALPEMQEVFITDTSVFSVSLLSLSWYCLY